MAFDITTAQSQGRRDCQEDTLVAHFTQGRDLGFVVLADGMGGHAAGDIASKIVVTEVFSELLFQTGNPSDPAMTIPAALRDAAQAADACIAAYVAAHPATRGMGATLVAPVILHRSLWWISVGDSPLFLYRDGSLRQLNEDHSLAPQIDLMAAHGAIDPASARDHPDRNVLTSVLFGGRIARIDCPADPLALQDGDILIVASDGLQSLTDSAISGVLAGLSRSPSGGIASGLLTAVARLDDPDQDNVSLCVIRVSETRAPPAGDATTWRRHGKVPPSLPVTL